MSRNIISKSSEIGVLNVDKRNEEDAYVSRIIKLIPAEIVSIYIAVFNLIKSSKANPSGSEILQWIVFVLMLVITPFYLKKAAKIRATKQIVFCTLSFVFWVFSLGGPLDGKTIGGFTPQFLGAIFLPIYTLLIPLVYTKMDK